MCAKACAVQSTILSAVSFPIDTLRHMVSFGMVAPDLVLHLRTVLGTRVLTPMEPRLDLCSRWFSLGRWAHASGTGIKCPAPACRMDCRSVFRLKPKQRQNITAQNSRPKHWPLALWGQFHRAVVPRGADLEMVIHTWAQHACLPTLCHICNIACDADARHGR